MQWNRGYTRIASFTAALCLWLSAAPSLSEATGDIPAILERLDRLVQAEFGRHVTVSIDSDVFWPYGWYLRDFPTSTYAVLDADSEAPDVDVIFVPHWEQGPIGEQLVDYVALPYEHRWWWVPDLDGGAGGFGGIDATVGAWARWLWDRQPWDGTDDDSTPAEGQ